MWTDRNGAIGTDEAYQIYFVTEIWTYAKMTTLCAPKTKTQTKTNTDSEIKIHVPVILLGMV